MKKILIALSILVTSGIVGVAAIAQTSNLNQNDFINALQYCKPYTMSVGPIDILGMKVTTKKQIIGMRNGLCSYIEIVGPPDAKNTIRCHFTKEQINKLVFGMRNNSPGERVWGEYYNNNKVCTTETPGWD